MAVAECPPHEEANDCFRRHHGLKTHVDIVLLIPLREFRHDFSPPVFRIAIRGVRSKFRQVREQRTPAAAVATRASSDGGGLGGRFPGGISTRCRCAAAAAAAAAAVAVAFAKRTTYHQTRLNGIKYVLLNGLAHHSYSTTVRHKF